MKIIYLILGLIFLGLGILGVYLPLLPATPFLLLASYFLARGSDRVNKYFTSTNFYKNNIEPIKSKKGLTVERKFKILGVITLFILISLFTIKNLHARILLIFILIFHYLYFFIKVKTIKKEK